jgi:hypothetical protein
MTTPLLIKLPGCRKCERLERFRPCDGCAHRRADLTVPASICLACSCRTCVHNPAPAHPNWSPELKAARARIANAV